MENEIEIGVKVLTRIYLHVDGNELGTAFDPSKIAAVTPFEEGSIVKYVDEETHRYFVTEKEEDINTAIKNATLYKNAALKAINEITL